MEKRKKRAENSEGSKRKKEHLDLSLSGDVENGLVSPGFRHAHMPENEFSG